MPDEVGAIQIVAGVFGTVSASFLVFLQVQMLKTLFPKMSGRWAFGAVYGVAAITSLIVLTQADVAFGARAFIAWYIGTLALGLIAQGIYAEMFKVSVPGIPPGPDAEAVVIDDPTQRTDEHRVIAPRIR